MPLRALECIARKPIRLCWLLLPLMGFECVMSERPLSPPEQGFIDRAIIGDWASATDEQGQLALRVTRSQGGLLEVQLFDGDFDGVRYLRYRAYSSRLGEDTYANLELVGYGCEDCDDPEAATMRSEVFDPLSQIVADRAGSTCTFIIVKYELADADRLIVHHYGDSGLVRRAIEQRQLAGRVFGSTAGDVAGEPCITDTAERLREFYTENAAALFPLAESEALVRRRPAAAPR
jgi:hypothetical protein